MLYGPPPNLFVYTPERVHSSARQLMRLWSVDHFQRVSSSILFTCNVYTDQSARTGRWSFSQTLKSLESPNTFANKLCRLSAKVLEVQLHLYCQTIQYTRSCTPEVTAAYTWITKSVGDISHHTAEAHASLYTIISAMMANHKMRVHTFDILFAQLKFTPKREIYDYNYVENTLYMVIIGYNESTLLHLYLYLSCCENAVCPLIVRPIS